MTELQTSSPALSGEAIAAIRAEAANYRDSDDVVRARARALLLVSLIGTGVIPIGYAFLFLGGFDLSGAEVAGFMAVLVCVWAAVRVQRRGDDLALTTTRGLAAVGALDLTISVTYVIFDPFQVVHAVPSQVLIDFAPVFIALAIAHTTYVGRASRLGAAVAVASMAASLAAITFAAWCIIEARFVIIGSIT